MILVTLTPSGPGIIPPATGCVRAVMETKTMLEQAGYKLVPIPAPDIAKVRVKCHVRPVLSIYIHP